jgi:copper chaperone CopZ
MKRCKLLILACLGILVIGIGCGGAGKGISLVEDEGTEIRIYEVFGMNCPGCHGGVEKLVNKLSGVVASQANWKKQRLAVKVSQDVEVKDEDIIDAIKRANFTPGKRLK